MQCAASSHTLFYQSINVIECPEFRELLRLLCEDLHDTDIPRRTKLRELIIETWKDYFKVLKDDFVVSQFLFKALDCNSSLTQNSMGQISLTADIWSDLNMRPFLACTAYWVAKGKNSSVLKLKCALIAFHHLPGSHTGLNITMTLLGLINRAGIADKVSRHQLGPFHCTTTNRLVILHLTTLAITTPPCLSCHAYSKAMILTSIQKTRASCAYPTSSTYVQSTQQTTSLLLTSPRSPKHHSNSLAVIPISALSRTKHIWYSEHGMYCRFKIILERVMSATHIAVIPHMRTHSDKEEFPKK